jgi:hypothetical protein
VGDADIADHFRRHWPGVAQIRDLALGDRLKQFLAGAQEHFGWRQQAGNVEAWRSARGADLGVVLRCRSGCIVHNLDTELFLERLQHRRLDNLLVLAALGVDDQRVGSLAPNHKRCGPGECGSPCGHSHKTSAAHTLAMRLVTRAGHGLTSSIGKICPAKWADLRMGRRGET